MLCNPAVNEDVRKIALPAPSSTAVPTTLVPSFSVTDPEGMPPDDFTTMVKNTSSEIPEGLGVEVSLVLVPSLATFVLALPVMELLDKSVALITSVPNVLNVAEKVPVPPLRLEFDGKIPAGSVLLKWTVPP